MSKQSRKRPLIIAGVVILALVAVAAYFGKRDGDATKVTAEEVSKRNIQERVTASGKVFPVTEVKISSDVSGEIVDLLVEEGDSVVSGQLLAKVNPDVYKSAVERGAASVNSSLAQEANSKAGIERNKALLLQAKAEISRIKAQITNSRSIYERNVSLQKDGIISNAEFDASLSNLRTLEANLEAADANVASAKANLEAAKQTAKSSAFMVKSNRATLDEMRSNLKRTTIYAPMSGIVSSLSVEQGERVVGTAQMAGTEMMRISNLNAMEVHVDVSENDVLRVELSDEVEIEVDAYQGTLFSGKVTHIANSASNASTQQLTTDQVTNFTVKVNIDPASYSSLVSSKNPYPFRPGMSATVDINTNLEESTISVPIQSVTTRLPEEDKNKESKSHSDPNEVVFVVSGDSVEQVIVKTGIQDDEFIQVLSGLSGGESVVSAPFTAISKNLKQGKKIEVVKEEELYKEEK